MTGESHDSSTDRLLVVLTVVLAVIALVLAYVGFYVEHLTCVGDDGPIRIAPGSAGESACSAWRAVSPAPLLFGPPLAVVIGGVIAARRRSDRALWIGGAIGFLIAVIPLAVIPLLVVPLARS